MTISSTFRAAIAHSNELDKRLARRIGQHLDTTSQLVREITEEPKQLALPSAGSKAEFNRLKVDELNALLRGYKIRNRDSLNGRKLKKADKVALCVEHGLPYLPYDRLLSFYLQATA